MLLRYFLFISGVGVYAWLPCASSMGGMRKLRHKRCALVPPRFDQLSQPSEETELESAIERVNQTLAETHIKQKTPHLGSDKVDVLAQKLESKRLDHARNLNAEYQMRREVVTAKTAAGHQKGPANSQPLEMKSASQPAECLPESKAPVAPVPPKEVLEAQTVPEIAKSEMDRLERTIERLAPAEKTEEAIAVQLPVAVRAATLEEAQREVQEAEAEVQKAELFRQEKLDRDLKEELQHVIAEAEHASHAEASASAAAEREQAEAEAEATSAAAEAEPPLTTWGLGSKETVKPEPKHLPLSSQENISPAPAEDKLNVQGKAEAEKREAAEVPEEEEEEEGEDEKLAIQEERAEEQQEKAEEQQEETEEKSAKAEQAERTVGGKPHGKKPQIT